MLVSTLRTSALRNLVLILPLSTLLAQTPAVKVGAVYQCDAGRSFKAVSCSGSTNTDQCDVQLSAQGQANMQGKLPYPQVAALLAMCHLQTAAEAQNAARGGSAPAAAGPQSGPGGFKVGDTVQINIAFGWMDAKILRINGNSYFVHATSGADVWKPYPTELRRIGSPNAEDHANGIYALHDRVQVNVEGTWTPGEVITTMEMPMRYEIQVPGNRTAWAGPENLRFVGVAEKPAVPKAGVAPKPGLVSCAGKIEGRYATTGGFGSFQITFRAGKATVAGIMGSDETVECWMSGDKIYLHKPGDAPDVDMSIDVNNDGTLQTPLGEITKKGN